jgi:hypothetical protein
VQKKLPETNNDEINKQFRVIHNEKAIFVIYTWESPSSFRSEKSEVDYDGLVMWLGMGSQGLHEEFLWEKFLGKRVRKTEK